MMLLFPQTLMPWPSPTQPTRLGCLAPWQRALTLCCVALVSACASHPGAAPEPVAMPAQFKEAGLWQPGTASAAPAVPQSWWTLFNDPTLNQLQAQLLVGNQSLKTQAAQVRLAQATVQNYEAALWPTLGVTASTTRTGTPATNKAARSTSSSDALLANAAWEVDLWGRASTASDAVLASLQASQDDLAAARLSVQATLTQTYFSLRTAEAQQALLARTVSANQRSLELTQARYDAGVVGRSDVLQAQTQLSSAQAQLNEANVQRAQLEHAIAVLLGQAPATLSLTSTQTLPNAPAVPELLPSTLLERRADIAAAERRVASANLQVGVADAAYFPNLNLSASAGYRSSGISQLLSAPNLLWSVGPSLAATLVDGGARKAASEQARANLDLATSTYRQTVLTALQEVEDNLVLLSQLRAEVQAQTQALDAARRNLDITQEQYKAGTVSFLNVVTAQSAALSAESALLSVRNRQLAATNVLLKNLGGRWDAGTATAVAPTATP